MPRMILHLGAHKTATSYMQKKLALNADRLAAHNIHYEPLETLRKQFTPLLNENSTRDSFWTDELRGKAAVTNVLVSDENIIGAPSDLVREGQYYADSRRRLARACQLLGTETPEIFLALRDYASFTVSMYSELIRHREFVDFADYFAIYVPSGFSWIRVIEDIFEAVPGAKLTLWDFADFRSMEKQVFQAMLGVSPSELENPVGPMRESFSDLAVRALAALSKSLSHAEMKKLIKPISRNLPKGVEYPAFDPHSPDVKKRLREQYRDDLAAIALKFPQATFLT
jgi:hypothetical protein